MYYWECELKEELIGIVFQTGLNKMIKSSRAPLASFPGSHAREREIKVVQARYIFAFQESLGTRLGLHHCPVFDIDTARTGAGEGLGMRLADKYNTVNQSSCCLSVTLIMHVHFL